MKVEGAGWSYCCSFVLLTMYAPCEASEKVFQISWGLIYIHQLMVSSITVWKSYSQETSLIHLFKSALMQSWTFDFVVWIIMQSFRKGFFKFIRLDLNSSMQGSLITLCKDLVKNWIGRLLRYFGNLKPVEISKSDCNIICTFSKNTQFLKIWRV